MRLILMVTPDPFHLQFPTSIAYFSISALSLIFSWHFTEFVLCSVRKKSKNLHFRALSPLPT